ncbi:protein PALS1-like isoform X2 [Apostichopus japonicus]|uniref:protein PALS1-like isoform X2 n=1 Tax=Stichopus japonicus TaxID=307972 RepID=UPI003AB29B51
MNGGIQVDLITPNGGVVKDRHSYGLDNTGFTYQEQDSDSWDKSSTDESDPEDNMTRNQLNPVKDVLLVMGENDQRFGFSFIGGTDEGLRPTVDEMLPGSPADRADLEVGDEIIEVNGNTLESATHAEVITHIQQCVKSRTICLRVKRKSMSEADLENHRLKEAYVVANEEQAKAKLNGIASQKNVEAIDLATYTNNKEIHIPETNGHVEKEEFVVEHGEPVLEASPLRVHADLEEGLLTATNDPSLHAPPYEEEPLAESVQVVKRDSTVNIQERLSQLFPQDTFRIDDPPGDQMVATVGGDGPDLHFSDLETFSIDSSHQSSDPDTSEFVREQSVRQNVVTSSNLPAINFDDLLQESSQSPSQARKAAQESDRMTSNNANMAAVTPEKTPSRRPVREVAVDCPANFVAASGMKNPPNNYHGVNGQATMNGPTRVNGIETIPNNHTNGEANKVGKPKENNHFKVNNFTKNSSHSNSQNTPLLQPVSNKPLFEEKATSSQDYTNSNKPVDVQELFSCLEEIQSKLNDHEDREDIQFLKQLFHNSDFQQALSLHNQVAEVHQQEPLPLPEATNAELLAAEIALSTRDVRSPETDALRRIFADPHTKALLHAHDQIANRDPVQHHQQRHSPVKPGESGKVVVATAAAAAAATPRQVVPVTDGPDRIIRIDKAGNPLGATIVNDNEEVIIGRIIKGGMAEKTGLLHEGDRILEINGMDVNGKSVDEISDMLADVNGTITFRVIPARDIVTPQQPPVATTSARNMVHVKALFKYDPEDDMYIPCKELGLSFDKGDILHIINQEDSNWWQAHRDGEDDQSLAGLIPSKGFQMNREAMKKTLPDDDEPKRGCRCSKNKKNKKKKKKKNPYDAYADDDDSDELELYEEVGIYYANPERKRPIVLVGPPSVGINELKRKLLEDDTTYKAAVPHTSRSRKNHEIDGMDYHFTTKHQFELDIAAGKFVEYGEFGKNLYGISLESISSVVNEGRICILNLHPQFLRIIKNSDLHPYYIFIAPPSLDRLRQQRTDAGEHLKEEELRNIIEMGRSMEDVYGHYFDCVIIHYDHERAYRDLTTEIQRIQTEPQWVPIKWIRL